MKKIMKTALSLILCAGLFVSASALVLDTAETEFTAAESTATFLADVSTANAAPGKNIFTGTTNALTFDDASDLDYFTSSGFNSVSIEATTDIYGTSNSALKLVVPGTTAGNQVAPYLRAGFETPMDRPIAALFDFNDKWLAFQWAAGNTGYIDGGWNANKNYNVRKTNAATSTATSLTALKIDFLVAATTWTPQTNYMDNVAVIPYYKVTYDMPEGTADVVRYTLAEEDGNGNIALTMTADGAISGFATSYTVDETVAPSSGVNATFLGWALKDAPTEVVTSVALENKDIVLVPVYEVNTAPGKNIFTGTTNALTFSDASDTKYFTHSGFNSVSLEETTAIYGTANSALKLVAPGQTGTALYASLNASFDTPIDRPVAALFDFNDKYLAFSWGAGNTGYIDNGWNANKNYNVRKTNTAATTAASLKAFKLDFTIAATTWTPQNNYMDNLAVIPYYKVTYDMPEGTDDVVRYTLAEEDGNGNIALTMTADGAISGFATNYTVDNAVVADGGAGFKFLGWALEEAPTEIVTSVTLENEDIVLVPVFEERELVTYSEQYGEMIFTTNLEGDTYNITNATLLGLLVGGDNEAVTYDENTGFRGYGLTEGAFYPVTWAQGGGFEFAVPEYASAIRYNEGADVLGTVTIVFNAYNEGTSAASWYDYFKQPSYEGGTAWTGLRSTYFTGTAPAGTWSEVVYTNSYIEEATTIIGLSQKDRRDVVYGDITVYVKPANALWLTDENGENRTFEIASETSYTFPASFNDENVDFWTDGEVIYMSGETVALSDIAGKTFKIYNGNIAPDVLDVSSIRTSGKKGIRFASFVDAERKAYADSYGFIVTRESFLDSVDELVFDENGSVSGVNEYGVLYVSGTAYNKESGLDRVYATDGEVFGDKGLGEGTYFTAVLYNIDEANYSTKLVMRPYIEKNGKYFYGDIISRSLYQVACGVRDGGYKGLDDAGIDYVDDIINTVEQ